MQYQTKTSDWMRVETFEAFANKLGKSGFRIVSTQYQERDVRGIFQREVNLPPFPLDGDPQILTERVLAPDRPGLVEPHHEAEESR